MSERRSNEWDARRKKIAFWADQLVERHGGSNWAVNLRTIAGECKISRVIFRPLLVEGGLARDGKQLLMFVRCNEGEIAKNQKLFDSNDGFGLPARMRFTIAHEIAHTFFIEWSEGTPRVTVAGVNSTQIETLEYTCNSTANRLLLSQTRFRQHTSSGNRLCASMMFEFAKKCQISLPVLLFKLGQERDWGDERGAAIIVNRSDGMAAVKHMVTDVHSERLFTGWSEGTGLSILSNRCADLNVFGGSSEVSETVLPCSFKNKPANQKCRIESLQYGGRNNSFLVTVSLKGEPIQDEQRRLQLDH